MNIVLTDCGRTSGEKLDCTVRALAKCLNVEYGVAHAQLKALGRKDKHRFGFWGDVINKLNLITRPDLSCQTFRKAFKDMQKGNFIVRKRGHVFAVIDGIIYDTEPVNFNDRVKMVYEKVI